MDVTTAERVTAAGAVAAAILPREASPIEKALLTVELLALADADPRVIATAWDPWRCPTVLLPWLAWALSVDVWDPAWPEARKRKMIAASPMVHRLKGTRGAVRRALDAFDLDSTIVEWWEETPPSRRGTFRVEIIYADGGPVFDLATQIQAIEAVRSSKPKSRIFTTRATIPFAGPLGFHAHERTSLAWTVQPFQFTGETIGGQLFAGAITAGLLTHTINPKE
ncbi:phage tail protein I [Aurantimonas aggregata]|uniref:phage tail protein I n=1 Tax=Aurantimonas aggregata TaxID=2047720 RepID=UPI0031B5E234